jgi:hypothetical protein
MQATVGKVRFGGWPHYGLRTSIVRDPIFALADQTVSAASWRRAGWFLLSRRHSLLIRAPSRSAHPFGWALPRSEPLHAPGGFVPSLKRAPQGTRRSMSFTRAYE